MVQTTGAEKQFHGNNCS